MLHNYTDTKDSNMESKSPPEAWETSQRATTAGDDAIAQKGGSSSLDAMNGFSVNLSV